MRCFKSSDVKGTWATVIKCDISCYRKQGGIIDRELKQVCRACLAQGSGVCQLGGGGVARGEVREMLTNHRQKISTSYSSPWSLRPKVQLASINSTVVDEQKQQPACWNNSCHKGSGTSGKTLSSQERKSNVFCAEGSSQYSWEVKDTLSQTCSWITVENGQSRFRNEESSGAECRKLPLSKALQMIQPLLHPPDT